MPKVITIVSQNNNTGKTTTLINLSAWLGLLGKKVLIIDLDQKSVATDFLINKDECFNSIESVILEQIPIDEAIVDTSVKGLCIVPTINNDISVGLENLFETDIFSLRDSIDLIEENFDYIFLDIPGSISNTYKACLIASDSVIVSLKSETEEIENINNLIKSIAEIKFEYNNWIELSGLLITLYNNQSSVSSQVYRNLKEKFGDLMYKTTITKNNLISESCNAKTPVALYDIKSFGAETYLRLAKEFIQYNSI